MKEVDARGLSCPEPIMLTAEALKESGEPVKVLVSEPHQRMNVEKYAKDHGKKVTVKEKGSEFEIVIES
nr:sulfurtransferase TusA family protein [uncultured Sellimonas sp.]